MEIAEREVVSEDEREKKKAAFPVIRSGKREGKKEQRKTEKS